MSNAIFYKWRARYGGMDASMMKRLNELEDENRRLKKMCAGERLKAEIIQETMEKSGKATSAQGNGQKGRGEDGYIGTPGLLDFCGERNPLSLSGEVFQSQCLDSRRVAPVDHD